MPLDPQPCRSDIAWSSQVDVVVGAAAMLSDIRTVERSSRCAGEDVVVVAAGQRVGAVAALRVSYQTGVQDVLRQGRSGLVQFPPEMSVERVCRYDERAASMP